MKIEISDVKLTEVVSKKGANPWIGKLVLSANAERPEDKEYFLSILKGTFYGYTVSLIGEDPTADGYKASKENIVVQSKKLPAQLNTISATTKVADIAVDTLTLINQFVCEKLTERLPEVEADAEAPSAADAEAPSAADAEAPSAADADTTNKADIKLIGPCVLGFALVILGMALPRYLEGK